MTACAIPSNQLCCYVESSTGAIHENGVVTTLDIESLPQKHTKQTHQA